MFWNKKEEKKLPELPPIQSPFTQMTQTSTHEDENDDNFNTAEKHSLPSFPDSPIKKGFSQAAIKDAVSNSHENENSPNSPFFSSSSIKTIEMPQNAEDIFPSINSVSKLKYSPASSLIDSPQDSQNTEKGALTMAELQSLKKKSSSDVFIKIEKFHSAKKALETVQQQIEQIDELLKKIRETKLKEEQELAAWEKEISNAKTKIQNVNETIFEKTE